MNKYYAMKEDLTGHKKLKLALLLIGWSLTDGAAEY